jgi:adenylate cyclase
MKWATKTYSREEIIPIPREKVWELISNNERLNRVIQLFPVKFTPVIPGTFFREAEAKANGFITMRWIEHPFQWVKNERYTVERVYSQGPFARFIGGVELQDADTLLPDGSLATKLRLYAEFTPANVLGVFAAWSIGAGGFKPTFDYIKSYIHLLEDGKENELPQIQAKYEVNTNQLDRLLKELEQRPVINDYVAALRNHLIVQGDEEVIEMQPHALAHQWKADVDEVLRLCLYATKVGILNLSWNLLCPNCRVPKSDYGSLSLLKPEFHCDMCGVEYTANFDQYVELRFSVHPNIRKAMNQLYCIGSPYLTPHIWLQKVVEKGQTVTIAYPDTEDPLRVRVLLHNHVLSINHDVPYPIEQKLVYKESGWSEDQISLPVIGAPLVIRNEGGQDIIVVLEKVRWSKEIITAAKVTAMQEFRDLFSSEVLAPGQQVGIENVTILFSDLMGSTALYESVGDAHAYGQVRRHFEFLTYWIAKNSGSLVKTIGDAVMAVFHLPEHAVRAALDIQSHVAEFNAKSPDEEPIIIKLGLHTGPAIAVNSNDRLDYFGRTVNISARVQGQSQGGDIILSEDCYNREEVIAILEKNSVNTNSFQTSLKGIDGEATLKRIWLRNESEAYSEMGQKKSS